MQTNHPNNQKNEVKKPDFDIQRMLLVLAENWYWFVLSVIIFNAGAYLYFRYTIPTYKVSTTLLISEGDQNRLAAGFDQANLLEGFTVNPGAMNVDNQIIMLSSRTLIKNALSELDFEIEIFEKGLKKTVSYYPLNPIKIIPDRSKPVPWNIEFSFEYISGNLCRIESNGILVIDTIIAFGKPLEVMGGSITILPHPGMEEIYTSGDKIYFRILDQEKLTNIYRRRLHLRSISEDGSVIELSMEGTNPVKDKVFLDKLTEVYLGTNLQKKNHEANRIVAFIDSQLEGVSDSLTTTENELQEFRSRNRIMDVSAQATQIIDQALQLENVKAQLELENNYYEYLEEYLSKDNNQEVPISPATMGIQDPLLARLMQELAGLQAEYFSSGVSERNPLQAQLEVRIRNTKESIRETLDGIRHANRMAIRENEQQIRRLNSQASDLPEKERQLLGIERKFNLNNVLYTYLLQKRAEAQIQKASNQPDNELIDPANAEPDPISPIRNQVHMIGTSLGIVVPFILLILGRVINFNISSDEDMRMITDLPVVGHIPRSRLRYNTVVLTEPNSRIAEAFRSLRTRMDFFTKQSNCPIIMVSSSMPNEGKTFVSINLASAYSLTGKKTVLIGFDLRRPALSSSFEMNGEIGLSTFLIGKWGLNKIVFETDYPNLYLIPSGPIPPNPSELSNSEKTRELLTSLREQFDYIIIDSAPIGTVADNFVVADMADAILMVVRDGVTKKNHLSATLSDLQSSGVRGLSLLLNDFKLKKSSYRYAYRYKYGDAYTKAPA